MVTCKVLLWSLLGVARSVAGTITAAQVQEANAAAVNIPGLACVSGVVFICTVQDSTVYTLGPLSTTTPILAFVLPDLYNSPTTQTTVK